jgi:hypothetical protein
MVVLALGFCSEVARETSQFPLGKPDGRRKICGMGMALHVEVLLKGGEQLGVHGFGNSSPNGTCENTALAFAQA